MPKENDNIIIMIVYDFKVYNVSLWCWFYFVSVFFVNKSKFIKQQNSITNNNVVVIFNNDDIMQRTTAAIKL